MTKPTRINEIDAKGGKRVKGMPYVLGISLAAIIMISAIVFAAFAS